eukprot:2489200-Alexandrium_andersonii.AAC.1
MSASLVGSEMCIRDRLYEAQLDRGAHFLHEHPASATSWDTREMQELLSRPGVSSGIGHMC